ncbi:TPA: stage II sporulation protein M [archaeon]|uniref:Stage II sporulation protein M n=1 Tax=Candidatus Naiadarchaeum limnaeum TaxID=2756139 RepID=A0A832V176_9ARCH|nr:stage II sporulation protein M [Candidatus Naiadarchaeales archaeon SRR2090153.bin1042]HIK00108.1 stage II sporulation protein M [Candidatus Naiadarchaeum limnaeum]
MVLESIISAEEVERHPLDMFFLGFGTASLGLWLAYYIFPKEASNWFLFLTAFALEPLLLRLFYLEEEEEITLHHPTLWQRHEGVIMDYMYLFFGMVIAFSFWYALLPQELTNIMFENQISEVVRIQNLRVALTGGFIGTGAVTAAQFGPSLSAILENKTEMLKFIMINNLRLLFLFAAFSFIFGAGAILLLTWNAAVVGVAVGNLARQEIVAAQLSVRTVAYFKALPISFLAFFVHGIFEILGYFIGAIGGGILSVAIIKKHYNNPRFNVLLWDVLLLILISAGLIIFGAFVEVYITPNL